MNTQPPAFNPFTELAHAGFAGARSSWRVIWGRLCVAAFSFLLVGPLLEQQGIAPGITGWITRIAWFAALVFAVLWIVASRRQQAWILRQPVGIDVQDLPRRDPTASGTGILRAMIRWVAVVAVFGGIGGLMVLAQMHGVVMSEGMVAVFVIVILVGAIAGALFITHQKPTDTQERFAVFAARNAFTLETGAASTDMSYLLTGVTQRTKVNWTLHGVYCGHRVMIALLGAMSSAMTLYVIQIDNLRIPTGSTALHDELARYDTVFDPYRQDDSCVLYSAGRNQVMSQRNFIRLFAAIEVAVRHRVD